MPLFICDNCGCVENTATSNFWGRKPGDKKYCLKCDPTKDGLFKGGKHHGLFSQRQATEEEKSWVDASGLIRYVVRPK